MTALNVLNTYEEDPLSESDRIHLVVESLRRAFCDRAKYAGDPDFTHIPVTYLLSNAHTKNLRSTINLDKATPSEELKCGLPSDEQKKTTHFSIMDKEGNRVAATLTINGLFGSGFVVPGTGVLLNNEMDDFSGMVGEENLYGLVGHASNLIAPQKRPVSSMMPTFIESKKGIAIFGTPGGSRIPSMMLLTILAADQSNFPLAWVSMPRYHHQYLPNVISYEPEAFSPEIINALRLRGHKLEPVGKTYGNMQMVYWDKAENKMSAISDPRGSGQGLVKKITDKQ